MMGGTSVEVMMLIAIWCNSANKVVPLKTVNECRERVFSCLENKTRNTKEYEFCFRNEKIKIKVDHKAK